MSDTINDILARHKRIALQFSGGQDSLACLYLMRPHWDRMTVYWLNTGAAYPETVNTVVQVCQMVPNFETIQGRQPQVIAEFGMPTDLLPASATPMGVAGAGHGVVMQDRYSCCLRSIMLPMHERMVEDGVTLIIRGQKNADRVKSTVRSGHVENGIEYLFPIEDWSSRQVMDFLRAEGAPVPRFYEVLAEAPDCMNCTAWWEKGEAKYLKRYHHAQHLANQEQLQRIKAAVNEHIAAFNTEVEP